MFKRIPAAADVISARTHGALSLFRGGTSGAAAGEAWELHLLPGDAEAAVPLQLRRVTLSMASLDPARATEVAARRGKPLLRQLREATKAAAAAASQRVSRGDVSDAADGGLSSEDEGDRDESDEDALEGSVLVAAAAAAATCRECLDGLRGEGRTTLKSVVLRYWAGCNGWSTMF